MTKIEKLKLCNILLLFSTTLILASSIQLEATGSRGISWVWVHVIVGCTFFSNIIWHLYLHFGYKSWLQPLSKQKSRLTRWLAVFTLLTLISAFVALFHWIGSHLHSPAGAIHGKIGFVFLALTVVHTIKRIKFFKLKSKSIRK